MSVYDRDMDVCSCGHVRVAHDYDVDFNGERYVGSWGACSGEHEDGTKCECERWEE